MEDKEAQRKWMSKEILQNIKRRGTDLRGEHKIEKKELKNPTTFIVF